MLKTKNGRLMLSSNYGQCGIRNQDLRKNKNQMDY